MRHRLGLPIAVGVLLAVPSTVGAHWLDHAPPGATPPAEPPPPTSLSGGEDAEWEIVATVPTGNPHNQ